MFLRRFFLLSFTFFSMNVFGESITDNRRNANTNFLFCYIANEFTYEVEVRHWAWFKAYYDRKSKSMVGVQCFQSIHKDLSALLGTELFMKLLEKLAICKDSNFINVPEQPAITKELENKGVLTIDRYQEIVMLKIRKIHNVSKNEKVYFYIFPLNNWTSVTTVR